MHLSDTNSQFDFFDLICYTLVFKTKGKIYG
jgi:hypothetical protein